MSVRQRRGKKDSTTESSTDESPPTPTTTTSSSNDGTKEKRHVQEQLDSALLSVVTTREKTKELHAKWREHLFRMCCIALVVCFHQVSTPLMECLTEIKDANKEENTEDISVSRAIVIAFTDSACEFVGIALVAITAYFTTLRDPPGDFSSWPYLLANAMVPFQLGLYYQTRIRKPCIPSDMEILEDAIDDEDGNVKLRSFPIAIILNFVVSAAYWFMRSGMKQCEESVEMVEDMKRQLLEAQEKNKNLKEAVTVAAKKKRDKLKK